MQFRFESDKLIRGGPPIYNPESRCNSDVYQPFNHSTKSRADRIPAMPIPEVRVTVDLGCGIAKIPGSIGLDLSRTESVDIQCDLFGQIPIKSKSVDLVWARQFLEHIPHKIHTQSRDGLFVVLDEVHRVLRPGGLLRVEVPHAYAFGAYSDPTHTRFFLPQTFNYFEPEGPFGYYSTTKFRVLALRFTYGLKHGFINEYHLSNRFHSARMRNIVRVMLGPKLVDICAILQAV